MKGCHLVVRIPWQAWLLPVGVSGVLILSVVAAFIFLTTLLRRQWVDNEKLTFPLAQLPLEMMGEHEGVSFFRNPLTWLGIAVPVVYYGVDWIHQLNPTRMPLLPSMVLLNTYLTTPPLNAIAYTPVLISFAAVGFFFLLPSDILFSIWFFFVLTRVEQVVAFNMNMDQPAMPLYPPPMFVGYQTMGAYFVLVAYLLIVAKPHLTTVWLAIRGSGDGKDASEMFSYRTAFPGGFALACWSACALLTFLGMSWWLAAFELLIFVFVIAIVMARSTAEAGMLMTETTFRPIDVYRMIGSVHGLGPANLTMLAYFDNLILRDQRGLLLTGFLDSSKIMDGRRWQQAKAGRGDYHGVGVRPFGRGSATDRLALPDRRIEDGLVDDALQPAHQLHRLPELLCGRLDAGTRSLANADVFHCRCASNDHARFDAFGVLLVAASSPWLRAIWRLEHSRILVSVSGCMDGQVVGDALRRSVALPAHPPAHARDDCRRVRNGGRVRHAQYLFLTGSPMPPFPVGVGRLISKIQLWRMADDRGTRPFVLIL